MKCPTCGKEFKPKKREMRWLMDLRYLSCMEMPVWGGPLKRGIDMLVDDADLAYLVTMGYAKQVDQEGFVITDLGREYLSKGHP
jgi:hypothetical protein